MRKTTLAPGQLLRSVHMEKSYVGKAGCTTGNPPLEVAPGEGEIHVISGCVHTWAFFSEKYLN